MTSRTIDIDRLFTRDIFFKDASNRPISANKILLTRGDGGIYFSNLPDGGNNSTPTAFNNFRAGDNLQFSAGNASNTLWFESGAGIQYYSTIDGLQPKFWIAATAPEQIRVTANGTGVMNFSSLTDELVGGRTLYFAGTGDTTVNVSDTTVLFGSAYNSSYSSLVQLQSTTLDLYLLESTLVSSLNQTLSTVNFFLLSTSVSSFYSTLRSVEAQTDYLSSFVWSTFTKDVDGYRNIMTINQISSSHVQASTVQVGSNRLSDAATETSQSLCTPYIQDGYTKYNYSTSANQFTLTDSQTTAQFAIEKDAYYGTSSFFFSTFDKVVLQTQTGIKTQLSTDTSFVPILQQLEIRESENTSGVFSSIIDYRVVNIANLDEICAHNGLVIQAPVVSISTLNVSSITGIAGIGGATSTFTVLYAGEIKPSTLGGTTFIDNATLSTIVGNVASIADLHVSSINGIVPFPSTFSTAFFSSLQTIDATISTLNVSTINGIQPFFNPQLSTFSTLIVSSLYGNQGILNDLQTSSINGLNPHLSTYSTLQASTFTSDVVSTVQLYADAIYTRLINVSYTSTTMISTSIIQANIVSSAVAYSGSQFTTDLHVSTINGREPFISSYAELFASTFNNMIANISDLNVSSINGVVPFPSTFSTAFFSTSQTTTSYISTLIVSSINGVEPFFNPQLSSFSSIFISTIYGTEAHISDLYVSTINGLPSHLSSYSTFTVLDFHVSSINGHEPVVSSYEVLFASTFNNMIANISDLHVSSINGIVPFPSTFSTAFFSTSQTNASYVSSLIVSSINGVEPFFQPQLSSFSTIYISTMYNNQGTISELNVSSINGFAPFLSSFSTFTAASVTADIMSTGRLIADVIEARLINVSITSTTLISTSIIQANIISSFESHTGFLDATSGIVTDLQVSSINGREPFVSSYAELFASTFNNMIANISDLHVSSINGVVPFPSTFSTAFFSTSQTTISYISNLIVSSINGIEPFFQPQLSSFSTIFISTMYNNQSYISDLIVSSINGVEPFFQPQLSSFSTIYVSTVYNNQSFISDLNVSSINGFAPFISSFDTLSVQDIQVSSINGREPFISSYEVLFASTFNNMIANISDLHVSSINGVVPFPSTFSTAFFSTSQTELANVTELFVSSINGREPIVSSYEILFASTFYNMLANISDLHVSSINGIVPFPSTFSTAYVSSLTTDSISTGILYADSIIAQYIDVKFISTTILSSFEITADLVSTSLLNANSAAITDLYISTINGLPYLTSSFSTLAASTMQADNADISDLIVSSINGINPFFQETISTFSTLYWSTAQGLDASISTLRLSTVMGNELPIFTFDMENRRVGVNLGPTQQPRCALDINGIAYASNFVTMSDRRHKKNVSTLDVDLETLPRGYRFQWRKDDTWDIGCMADEVEAFAPEAVFLTHDGDKTVSYHKLVPACLNMIRKLTERMTDLEKKLEMYKDL